ncbi:MAG: lysylphosphatidylglycerol synthase transmembrane domain-containing protein [Candidatus Saccharimonadales bacterium]
MAEKTKRKWRKIITTVTLLALAVLIYATWDEITDSISNLVKVQAAFLLLAIIFKIATFHTYTKMYQALFKILDKKINYKPMIKAALELSFVNNVFPSGGVTGFSYFGIRMKKFHIRASTSTLVQILRFAIIFVTFMIMILSGLLMLALFSQVSNLTILFTNTLSVLLTVGIFICIYIIGSRSRIDNFFTFITRVLNKIIQVIRPKHPETINIRKARVGFINLHENYLELRRKYKQLLKPGIYALVSNIFEVVTLYTVFLAFGETINPGAVIIAYAVANFAGLVSVLPGGVGIYEALMTAVLATAGVPPAVSIPVIIMYRILTMIIQLPIGYYFYHKFVNEEGIPDAVNRQ